MLQRGARLMLTAAITLAMLAGVPPASASSAVTASDSSSVIVFDTRYSAAVSQIYTIRPDGSGLQQLTHSTKHGSWDPSFSPQGTEIAFARDGSRGSVIVVMDNGGIQRHRLRSDAGYDDYAPTFTPDGNAIVFVRCQQGPGYPCRIARMALDGSHLVQLTHGSWHDGAGPFGGVPGELGPSVNEENGRIAFGSDRGGYDARIFVMDADGAHLRAVTRPALVAGNPSWSKEGVWIAVTGGTEVGTTFLVHPDGSDVHPVEPGVLFAAFGPTGRWLVGVQESTGSLVTFASNGGTMTSIPGTSGATFADWSSAP
jgi:Tol biopolymer transport system component